MAEQFNYARDWWKAPRPVIDSKLEVQRQITRDWLPTTTRTRQFGVKAIGSTDQVSHRTSAITERSPEFGRTFETTARTYRNYILATTYQQPCMVKDQPPPAPKVISRQKAQILRYSYKGAKPKDSVDVIVR